MIVSIFVPNKGFNRGKRFNFDLIHSCSLPTKDFGVLLYPIAIFPNANVIIHSQKSFLKC